MNKKIYQQQDNSSEEGVTSIVQLRLPHKPQIAFRLNNYGLARKNSLIGIAQRINKKDYQTCKAEKTEWHFYKGDIIGMQQKHKEELGVGSLNFFQPSYMAADKSDPVLPPIMQSHQGSLSKDSLQIVESNESIKWKKKNRLEKFLNEEQVQLIDSQILRDKIQQETSGSSNTSPRPSRVAKVKERISYDRSFDRKKRNSEENKGRSAGNRPKANEKPQLIKTYTKEMLGSSEEGEKPNQFRLKVVKHNLLPINDKVMEFYERQRREKSCKAHEKLNVLQLKTSTSTPMIIESDDDVETSDEVCDVVLKPQDETKVLQNLLQTNWRKTRQRSSVSDTSSTETLMNENIEIKKISPRVSALNFKTQGVKNLLRTNTESIDLMKLNKSRENFKKFPKQLTFNNEISNSKPTDDPEQIVKRFNNLKPNPSRLTTKLLTFKAMQDQSHSNNNTRTVAFVQASEPVKKDKSLKLLQESCVEFMEDLIKSKLMTTQKAKEISVVSVLPLPLHAMRAEMQPASLLGIRREYDLADLYPCRGANLKGWTWARFMSWFYAFFFIFVFVLILIDTNAPIRRWLQRHLLDFEIHLKKLMLGM